MMFCVYCVCVCYVLFSHTNTHYSLPALPLLHYHLGSIDWMITPSLPYFDRCSQRTVSPWPWTPSSTTEYGCRRLPWPMSMITVMPPDCSPRRRCAMFSARRRSPRYSQSGRTSAWRCVPSSTRWPRSGVSVCARFWERQRQRGRALLASMLMTVGLCVCVCTVPVH